MGIKLSLPPALAVAGRADGQSVPGSRPGPGAPPGVPPGPGSGRQVPGQLLQVSLGLDHLPSPGDPGSDLPVGVDALAIELALEPGLPDDLGQVGSGLGHLEQGRR